MRFSLPSIFFLFTLCSGIYLFAQASEQFEFPSLDSLNRYAYEIGDSEKSVYWVEKYLIDIEEKFGENSLEYADAADLATDVYYFDQNFEAAADFAKFKLHLLEKLGGSERDRWNAASDAAYCHKLLSEKDSTLRYLKFALDISKKIESDKGNFLFESYYGIGRFYYENFDLDQARDYLDSSLAFVHDLNFSEGSVGVSVVNAAFFLKEMGALEDAGRIYLLTKQKLKEQGLQSTRTDVMVTAETAYYYYLINELDSAKIWMDRALVDLDKVIDNEDPDKALIIGNAAVLYQYLGNYERAEKLHLEALRVNRQIHGDGPATATALDNFGVFYSSMGDNKNAIDFFNEALEIRLEAFGEESPDVALSYGNLGTCYIDLGKISEGVDYLERSIRIYKKIYGESLDYAGFLGSYAGGLELAGKYEEGLKYKLTALKIISHYCGEYHTKTAEAYNNLSITYQEMGEYFEAERALSKAVDIMRNVFDADSPAKAIYIENLSTLYYRRGRYDLALPLAEEVYEMRKRLYKSDHPDLISSFTTFANIYYNKGEFKEAQVYQDSADAMADRFYESDNPQYLTVLQNSAIMNKRMGRIAKATEMAREAYEMCLRLYDEDNYMRCLVTKNYASINAAAGNYEQAKELFEESLAMHKRLFKLPKIDRADIYFEYADCLEQSGDPRKAADNFTRAVDILLEINENLLPTMSEKSKEAFLSQEKGYYSRLFHSFAMRNAAKEPEFLKTALKERAAFKGAVLNSSLEIKSRVERSGDSSLIALYGKLLDSRSALSAAYSMSRKSLESSGANVDSIKTAIETYEKELSMRSRALAAKFDKGTASFDEIAEALRPGEAAVEIVRFDYYFKKRLDSTIYLAYVVEPGAEYPKIAVFAPGKDLEGKYFQNYRKSIQFFLPDPISYEVFWKPLAEKLEGIEAVYLSPDGVFNKISFAGLKNPKSGEYLFDELDLRIVGSLRELTEKSEPSLSNRTAALFGDPKFDLFDEDAKSEKAIPNAIDRGTFRLAPLPDTRTEIESVEAMLKAVDYDVASYVGEQASEKFVKEVDSPEILHLATHGKFLESLDTPDDVGTRAASFSDVFREDAMLRSFLTFSGAQTAADAFADDRGISAIPEMRGEDGFLTAFEAVNLDLYGTKLAVLSACETGLGEIRDGEGVYGLQRAFQLAGAERVVMSLWSVNSAATNYLMRRFYFHYLSGTGVREALRAAQVDLREELPEPFFWASFVVIGAGAD